MFQHRFYTVFIFLSIIQFGTVSAIFTGLSIVIATIGLLGLLSFMISGKIREIAIRKVLGASQSHILYILSQRIIIFILISGILATVGIYFTIDGWLNQFAFRIALSPLHFIVPILGLLLLSSVIILWQSFKTLTANPIKWIRDE